MKRENSRSQPRAWHFQPQKNAPHKKCVAEVKENIYPVISGRLQIPEEAFDSQNCVSEWKILRRRIERKPDSTQTVRRHQQMIGKKGELPYRPTLPAIPILCGY